MRARLVTHRHHALLHVLYYLTIYDRSLKARQKLGNPFGTRKVSNSARCASIVVESRILITYSRPNLRLSEGTAFLEQRLLVSESKDVMASSEEVDSAR